MVLRQRLTKHTTLSMSLHPPQHDDKEELRLSMSSFSSSSEEEGEQFLKSSSLDDGSQKEEEHQVDDVAREQHDVFNLVALIFVLASTAMDWDVLKLRHVGDYFYLNWATTLCYFLVDLLWVFNIPQCVKSPGVIIKHHFVAIIYLSAPIFWPHYRWVMGGCLSVEINTWFMIARRVMYKRKDQIPAFVQDIISCLFFFSWITIRIFLYPWIMYLFCKLWLDRVAETGKLFHWPMLSMPVHFALCVLNLKWSYDLFHPIIMKRLGKQKDEEGISSGL